MKRFAIVAVICLLAMPAFAQREGDNEFTAFMSVTMMDAADSYMGGVGYGRYVSPKMQLGLNSIFMMTSPDQGDDMKAVYLQGAFNYYFKADAVTTPYFKIYVGTFMYDAGGDDGSEGTYGAGFGFKHWMSPNAAFYGEALYNDLMSSDFDNADYISILFGLAYAF